MTDQPSRERGQAEDSWVKNLAKNLSEANIKEDDALWSIFNGIGQVLQVHVRHLETFEKTLNDLPERMRRLTAEQNRQLTTACDNIELESRQIVYDFNARMSEAQIDLRDELERRAEAENPQHTKLLENVKSVVSDLQLTLTPLRNDHSQMASDIRSRLEALSKDLKQESAKNASRSRWKLAVQIGGAMFASLLVGGALALIYDHIYAKPLAPNDVELYQQFRTLDTNSAAIWSRIFHLNDPFQMISGCQRFLAQQPDGQVRQACQMRVFIE